MTAQLKVFFSSHTEVDTTALSTVLPIHHQSSLHLCFSLFASLLGLGPGEDSEHQAPLVLATLEQAAMTAEVCPSTISQPANTHILMC